MSDQKIIPPGTLINGYKVISLLGMGGYASIYKVKDTKTNKEYAMKTELISSEVRTLPLEIECMKQFKEDFFPKLHDVGKFQLYNIEYLIMDLLGASLDTIQTFHHKKLDMDLVYNVCFNMLLIIQAFHSYGYVHRDIKPGNFLIQNNESCPLVLIDFGICQKHIDPKTDKPFPCGSETYFFGTERFASTDACRGYTQGRKDDLMAWFYSFLDLACGHLPWDEAVDFTDMIFMKKFLNISYLNRKFPKEIDDIFTYIKKLSYEEEPKYEYILQLYVKAMESQNIHFDQYNWRLFYRHHAHLESLTRVITLKHYNRFTQYNQIVNQIQNKGTESEKSNSPDEKIQEINGQTDAENKSSQHEILHHSLISEDENSENKSSHDISSQVIIYKNHILETDPSANNSKSCKTNIKNNNQKKYIREVSDKNNSKVDDKKEENDKPVNDIANNDSN